MSNENLKFYRNYLDTTLLRVTNDIDFYTKLSSC